MDEVERFLEEGFIKLDQAFPRELAEEGRMILWEQMGLRPDDPGGWTEPVVWASDFTGAGPFAAVAAAEPVREAVDRLAGPGRWVPRGALGSFPVRFPNLPAADDTGWHVDGGFTRPDGVTYGINLYSRGRALLLLYLFSDVGVDDAPTRIRVGSHLDVPAILAPAGEEGVEFFAAGPVLDAATAHRPLTHATGLAGDVYLCHPFLVHAAQPHRGTQVRFMAQPPIVLKEPLVLDRACGDYSPVERAVRLGLLQCEEL